MPARTLAAFAAICAVFVAVSHSPGAPNQPQRVTHALVAITTTVPATTTTTDTPPVTLQRASRGAVRPRLVARAAPDQATMDRVVAAIRSYADWNAELMVIVARCESGLDPWKINARSGATGIFQIMGSVTPGLIEEHVALAHSMWQHNGMDKWIESRSCWG